VVVLKDFLPEPLAEAIQDQYLLDMDGIHGLRHWIRVWNIGEELSRSTGANIEVVRYFAFLHDVCREDEDIDLFHGVRSAKLIKNVLQPEYLHLPQEELRFLEIAVQRHTFGMRVADVTVMTCWDSDRLDLGRVGIIPHPSRLCTDAAKDPDMIRRAYEASVREEKSK
jgi:uncharacterized protein